MLFLCFQLGTERYVVDTKQIIEVLPLVTLRVSPHAPRGVAGAFVYRGGVAPVLDFGEMARGQPCARRFSTRILMLDYPIGGVRRPLGIIVERATGTMELEDKDFLESGFRTPLAPYLGKVVKDEHRLIQSLDVGRLLPEGMTELLFGVEGERSGGGN